MREFYELHKGGVMLIGRRRGSTAAITAVEKNPKFISNEDLAEQFSRVASQEDSFKKKKKERGYKVRAAIIAACPVNIHEFYQSRGSSLWDLKLPGLKDEDVDILHLIFDLGFERARKIYWRRREEKADRMETPAIPVIAGKRCCFHEDG